MCSFFFLLAIFFIHVFYQNISVYFPIFYMYIYSHLCYNIIINFNYLSHSPITCIVFIITLIVVVVIIIIIIITIIIRNRIFSYMHLCGPRENLWRDIFGHEEAIFVGRFFFVSHQLISYGRFKINTVCSVDKVVWAPFLLPNFQNYCNKFIEVHSNEMNVKWNYLILSICSYCLNFKYFISVYVHLLSLYCSCCCCILCRLHVCRNVAIYVFGIFVFVFIFKYLFCT